MSDSDFDLFPEHGESDEQHAHRFQEAILGENWLARFQANGAAYRALGHALDTAEDTTLILELAEQRGESLVRCLGSGALSLCQRDTFAERQAVEAQFDSDSSPKA